MKNTFMKFIAIGLLCSAALVSYGADLVISTNVTASATSPAFILLPNRAILKQVMLAGGAGSSTVLFYDQNNIAAPYYGTNWYWATYVTNQTYATNITGTFVGYNGVTNFTTNQYQFTVPVTNAAGTNLLPVMYAAVVNANLTAVYTPPASIVFARGIAITVFTNVGITLFYTTP